MAEPALTTTSYLVLGLVRHCQPCTSYDLKQIVARSIGCFWTFPHSQLYAEPARLAGHGLLDEEQEAGGRRRRTYTITAAGRRALEAWLAEPADQPTEIRDLGLLKLFFSGATSDEHVVTLARAEEQAHRRRLADYEALRAHVPDIADAHQLATLDMGLRFERLAIAFWSEIAERPPGR